MISLPIDGKKANVREGTTVLEAARSVGVAAIGFASRGVTRRVTAPFESPSLTCPVCMICLRKCPAEAIVGGEKQIHVIDQEKCTNGGTCFEVRPSRFSAVRRLSCEPVPPPIPEETRILARESKER